MYILYILYIRWECAVLFFLFYFSSSGCFRFFGWFRLCGCGSGFVVWNRNNMYNIHISKCKIEESIQGWPCFCIYMYRLKQQCYFTWNLSSSFLFLFAIYVSYCCRFLFLFSSLLVLAFIIIPFHFAHLSFGRWLFAKFCSLLLCFAFCILLLLMLLLSLLLVLLFFHRI